MAFVSFHWHTADANPVNSSRLTKSMKSAPHGATRKQANLVLLGDREGDGRSSFDDAVVIDALSVLAQALSINSVDFTKLTALL